MRWAGRSALGRLVFLAMLGLLLCNIGHALAAIEFEKAAEFEKRGEPFASEPVRYLADAEPEGGAAAVINGDAESWVVVKDSPAISLGLVDGSHWFHVQARNISGHTIDSFLVIDNPLLDSVDVFLRSNGQSVKKVHLGDAVEFKQRLIDTPVFLVPMVVESGEQVEAYIRISNRDALKANIFFIDQVEYYRGGEINHILLFSLLASMMALALYHFVFFFKTREISFLFFSGFVMCAVFFFLVQSGYAYYLFWPSSPVWQNMSDPFSLGLMATFAVSFAISHLEVATFSPRLKRNFTLAVMACVLGCIFSIVLPYRASLLYMFLVYAVVIGLGAWIGVFIWRQRQELAAYYTIAWGFLLFGSAVRLLYELAVIPQSAFSENAFLLGLSFQVLFSGLGVASKYNKEKQMRLDAQNALLKEARYIIEQEKQLSDAQASLAKLKNDQAERLEVHVQQRTQALEAALKELHQAKMRAEGADKQKARFLAAASHDIRQPLNALSLMVESLKTADLSVSVRPRFFKMHDAVENLVRLFESLFDLSKLENDILVPAWEVVPIVPFMQRIGEALHPLFEAKGVALNLSVESADDRYVKDRIKNPCIKSDTILLQRVLWILVDNALQHSNCTQVCVRLECDQSSCHIDIEDDGIGIPEHELQNIFEEFYQLHNQERDRKKGMGLGLALCKRLVKMLEGELTVSSREGKGTCFRLSINRVMQPEVQGIEGEFSEDNSDTLPGLKVLLVEDDADSRSAMMELLADWNIDYRAAENAQQAWEQVNDGWMPDVALVDCRLPGDYDGVELADTLQGYYGASLTIVIISGEFDLPVQASAYRFMRKPIRPSRLRALLTGVSVASARVPAPTSHSFQRIL